MSEHAKALVNGILLGTAVIGVGGILIDTFSVAGLVILSIAIVGWSVFGYIIGGKK